MAEEKQAILGMLDAMRAEERRFVEELTADERTDGGSARRWGARATLAHVADFRREQVERLAAAAAGADPSASQRIDHADPEVYAGYLERTWTDVERDSDETAVELHRRTAELDERTLFTAGLYPWLNGRALWAQILVRGVWHPSAHLHQYLAGRGRLDRVVELQQRLNDAAIELEVPERPGGRSFAVYNLACAYALAGHAAPALAGLAEALRLHPGLAEAARTDPDLAAIRDSDRFAALVAAAA